MQFSTPVMVMVASALTTKTMVHPCSPSRTHQNSGIHHTGLQQCPISFTSTRCGGLNFTESWQRSKADSLKLSTYVLKVERRRWKGRREQRSVRMSAGEGMSRRGEPLKVIISGAPTSGKGTQCKLIVENFQLSHISTGDLLREEVAVGLESGKTAKEYMESGKLMPNEIVLAMVEKKLAVSERGWLLDGYPRSLEQVETLEAIKLRPQLVVILDVLDDILVERVVERRLDPVTGKIYHLKYSPPETEAIGSRFDDTEEKAKIRLVTYHTNVEAVIDVYKDIVKRVDGNHPNKDVFADVVELLKELQNKDEEETKNSSSVAAAKQQTNFKFA